VLLCSAYIGHARRVQRASGTEHDNPSNTYVLSALAEFLLAPRGASLFKPSGPEGSFSSKPGSAGFRAAYPSSVDAVPAPRAALLNARRCTGLQCADKIVEFNAEDDDDYEDEELYYDEEDEYDDEDDYYDEEDEYELEDDEDDYEWVPVKNIDKRMSKREQFIAKGGIDNLEAEIAQFKALNPETPEVEKSWLIKTSDFLGRVLTFNFGIVVLFFIWFLTGSAAQLGFKSFAIINKFRDFWPVLIQPLLTTHLTLTFISWGMEKASGAGDEGNQMA